MNIPARYATGYLGDIGVPLDPAPIDFSAWFEVYLNGPDGPRWHTFDARHNHPRIGRIVMSRGRDAMDCALSTSFGTAVLGNFKVHTNELLKDFAEKEPEQNVHSSGQGSPGKKSRIEADRKRSCIAPARKRNV